jgi:transglutaminase-like putative cysteine protease
MTGPTRRDAGLGLMAMAAGLAAAEETPADWLGETDYINHSHRAIRRVVQTVGAEAADTRDLACRLHVFVSEQIKFGFSQGFWEQSAADVLARGIGYCNTKSTLFTALLRAAGVPARQVFVDIDARVLSGLLDPGTPYVDHSYVEAFINGAWVASDAYIVDPGLFDAAKAKLDAGGDALGFGIHRDGSTAWDGAAAAFSQYPMTAAAPPGTRVWGIFADVGDFYARADGTWNRLNPLLRAAMPIVAAPANRRAEALRG